MIKRILCVVMCLCLFPVAAYAKENEPQISARCAALIVADSGELIYGKNEHEPRGMASTTKIMTALLAAEYAQPERVVIATKAMVSVEGTSMGLIEGDKVSFHDLVYGMLLASGNDAANTVAIAMDGSLEAFAVRMNSKAAQIGMTNTNFVTPSGLDNENHFSTAYDMALLGSYAIKNPTFAKACASVSAKLCYGNEPYTRYLSNHNRLLRSYEGAMGIKTGFTKKSGRCLVSAACRDGVTLVCATLCAPDDWSDHRALLDYGFEQVSLKTPDVDLSGYNIRVFGGTKASIAVETKPLQIATLCPSESITARVLISPYVLAPVKKGQAVGEVCYYIDNKQVAACALTAAESVGITTQEKQKKITIKQKIGDYMRNLFLRIFSER